MLDKPECLANPKILRKLEPKFDDPGRIELYQRGQPLRMVVFGDMATVEEGTRITARGDRYPYDAEVSLSPRKDGLALTHFTRYRLIRKQSSTNLFYESQRELPKRYTTHGSDKGSTF